MNIAIIGASRGIGKAAALELAKTGEHLLITGRDEVTLLKTKQELPDDTLAYPLDTTKEEDIDKLVGIFENEFPLDGLVLNAASFPDPKTQCSVLKPSVSELTGILDSNVTAHYRLVQKVLPIIQKSPVKKIVIIGSTSGVRQDKGGIYGISKWALRSYAYQLRDEAREYGIGVSLINPGGTFTEKRIKQGEDDRHLLETTDIALLIATVFRLSPQAVIEELNIRPLAGDTY
ncbi:MAG: SDR family oxidoreductase [Lachnospiraceae bacterium]|nr:SDR family oxidoreductase [Lachnospiraceae bacterium]